LFVNLGIIIIIIIIIIILNVRASRLKANDNTKDKGLSFPRQNTKDSFKNVEPKRTVRERHSSLLNVALRNISRESRRPWTGYTGAMLVRFQSVYRGTWNGTVCL